MKHIIIRTIFIVEPEPPPPPPPPVRLPPPVAEPESLSFEDGCAFALMVSVIVVGVGILALNSGVIGIGLFGAVISFGFLKLPKD